MTRPTRTRQGCASSSRLLWRISAAYRPTSTGTRRTCPRYGTFDPLPRVVLLAWPGCALCGADVQAAKIARDITAQTLAAKARIAAMGTYRGLSEDHLFEMEYFTLQHAKLGNR